MSSRHRWGVAGHHRPARTRPRRRTGVTLSGQSSAALGTEDERARLLAIASAILLFCTPQPSETGRPRRDRAGGRGALQLDGEELAAGRRSPCGQGPRRQDAVGQLPTGEADLIVRGQAERVRIIRTGVPASVETVARSLTAPPAAGTWHPSTPGGGQSRGTWAVQPRQPALRVLRLGVDPPSRWPDPAIPAAGSGRGAPASRPQKARPAPSWPERASSEMPTGHGGGATALLTGTSSGRTPEHRSFRCVPVPLPVPAGPSCVAAGTSGRTCGEPSRRHRLSYVLPVTGRR
jgi:hypothetical protein